MLPVGWWLFKRSRREADRKFAALFKRGALRTLVGICKKNESILRLSESKAGRNPDASRQHHAMHSGRSKQAWLLPMCYLRFDRGPLNLKNR